MNKRQHKGLPQASWRPDHLAEEVDLPERIDMEFEELIIPSAATTLGARSNPFFLEDVCNGRLADGVNPQFFQFTKDATVSPPRLPSQSNDNLTNRFQSARSGLLATGFFSDPPLVSSAMDDRDQLRGPRPYGSAQLEQPLSFLSLQKDPLLGHSSSEHFVFSLEQFNVPAQFILRTSCQIEQKRRKPTCHAMAPCVIEVEQLFAPLESTVQRAFYPAEMTIDVRLGQSMKIGDNCAG